ncbi:MAG TPA: hypothetical protein VGQ69_06135 [Gemmatimonadales bacterium]|jgi:hypothetical protein|nr:hypothetical protein [Gemmatimonadales bacterium]
MAGRSKRLAKPRSPQFADCVFVNCPFDAEYWPIFEAIVFCILDCGFTPRSALEFTDSGEVRVHRLRDLIRSSKYAVHDLSRVELSDSSGMPRFNMPFELGLDLGARWFGPRRLQSKRCLVLEGRQYAGHKALSDIAGQDLSHHGNSPTNAIKSVRDWLQGASDRKTLPGPAMINARFAAFSAALPELATTAGLDRHRLSFIDYVNLTEGWLRFGV